MGILNFIKEALSANKDSFSLAQDEISRLTNISNSNIQLKLANLSTDLASLKDFRNDKEIKNKIDKFIRDTSNNSMFVELNSLLAECLSSYK